MPQQLLIHARGAALDAAHGDIQIMPPGVHEITPSDADGKPISLKVTITSATAEALEAARASYQAAADALVASKVNDTEAIRAGGSR